MKKLKKLALFVCAFSALSFFACKSTPEEEPAPVEEEQQEVESEVQEEIPEESVEPELEAQDFSEANKSLLSDVENARQSAIDSGADKNAAQAFALTEAEYNTAKLSVQTSTEDMSKLLGDLKNRYDALNLFSQAKSLKNRIDELNFASYDQNSYDEGSKILEELSDPKSLVAFGSTWSSNAQKAKSDFEKVLDLGFRAVARDERTQAFKAKRNADEVKASVSRKADYDKAVSQFSLGDSKYVTKDPEGSIENYRTAKDEFTRLYEEISVLRAKAQAAVDEAKNRVAQSESTAQTADEEVPLGDENVEGIEDENATLLEEDDFSVAESSVVEVSENIDDVDADVGATSADDETGDADVSTTDASGATGADSSTSDAEGEEVGADVSATDAGEESANAQAQEPAAEATSGASKVENPQEESENQSAESESSENPSEEAK